MRTGFLDTLHPLWKSIQHTGHTVEQGQVRRRGEIREQEGTCIGVSGVIGRFG